MKYILTLVYAFLLFCLTIVIHEFGHFITAKILRVRVDEFAVGMGPAIFKKKRGETLYSLRVLPLGGYCAMGEDESDNPVLKNDPRAFLNQPNKYKALILIAGSFMNLVLSIIILYFAYLYLGANVFQAVRAAFSATGMIIVNIYQGLKMIFTGAVTSQDVMGIVGIASVVGEQAKSGILDVSYLMAVLSVNLGIVNMLPIPALDGGRVFMLIIKLISNGRISDKAEAIVHTVGMVLLMILMIFLIIKDSIQFF